MDSLPTPLLLEILSRLDDSADVARCRVASKAFNAVFPGLRSINLHCPSEYYKPRPMVWCFERYFTSVFIRLISTLETVESVCISHMPPHHVLLHGADFNFIDEVFVQEWLPRVSESLKSLSLSGYLSYSPCESRILPLISEYSHNLVTLNLKFAWLSVNNLNPMPMLTSLTLESARFANKLPKELNKCFPNLQVLNLVDVEGLVNPKIRLRNLKACHLSESSYYLSSLTLITPNLVTLKVECSMHATIHIEAPMLSHFHFVLDDFPHAGTFPVKNFENLKTLWLKSPYLYSLISEFPIMKTVEHLTLGKQDLPNAGDLRLSLAKVFMVFPNVSSLRVNSSAWSELEGWEILDGRKRLKRICAYLRLVDQWLTFSYIACVLDQCDGLLEVSLLIHSDVVGSVSKSFMSRCTARWPTLKWRWGIWSGNEDSWITDGTFN